jgi:hypothetical protein
MTTTMKPSDYTHTIVWHGPSYGAALELAALLWARHRIPVEIHAADNMTRVLFADPTPGEWPELQTVQTIVRDEFPQACQENWCVQFSELGEITEELPRDDA